MIVIPESVIPEKYHRGSVKWCNHAIKFAKAEHFSGEDIAYVNVLNAKPEENT